MAAKLCILVLSFVFATTISLASSPIASTSTKTTGSPDLIRLHCEDATFDGLCEDVLRKYAEIFHPNGTIDLTQIVITVTVTRLRNLSKRVAALARDATASKDIAKAMKVCKEALDNAAKAARQSVAELAELKAATANPKAEELVAKAQEYMGNAFTNENLCTDVLDNMADGPVKADVKYRLSLVERHTANSLSLLVDGVLTAS